MFQMTLKQLRERDGLSQVKLAGLLGVSQSTVGMWESGRNKPTFAMLHKIADVFDVSVGYLAGDDANGNVLRSETAGYATAQTIIMPDDAMAPDILRGDQLTLSPLRKLSKGDFVAFLKEGRTYVRYITQTDEKVVASARNLDLPLIFFTQGKEKEAGIQLLGRVVRLTRSMK